MWWNSADNGLKISKIHVKRVPRVGNSKKHPVPILEAQKRHPAAHPQYSQVWKYPPPPPGLFYYMAANISNVAPNIDCVGLSHYYSKHTTNHQHDQRPDFVCILLYSIYIADKGKFTKNIGALLMYDGFSMSTNAHIYHVYSVSE